MAKQQTKSTGCLTWVILIAAVIGLVQVFSAKRPQPPAAPAVPAPPAHVPPPVMADRPPAPPPASAVKPKPAQEALPDPDAKKPSVARARVLIAAGRNLDKADKKDGAIYFYRQVVMECRGTPESDQAIARLRALGGTVPDVSESIPVKEGDPYTPPKGRPHHHYASSAAARQEFDQMLSQAMQSAMSGGNGQGSAGSMTRAGAGGSHLCGAITQDGTPCRNPVQGVGFCYLHR